MYCEAAMMRSLSVEQLSRTLRGNLKFTGNMIQGYERDALAAAIEKAVAGLPAAQDYAPFIAHLRALPSVDDGAKEPKAVAGGTPVPAFQAAGAACTNCAGTASVE